MHNILTISMQVDQHGFHGFLHSADLTERELRRQLTPLGIHPRQARILEAMDRMGRVSQADLATAFGVTPASMSTMTDRLLAAGYITRAIDPATRRQKNILELTDEGRALLAGISEAWVAIDDTIRTILGKKSEMFFDLARRLRDGLDGTIPGTKNTRATARSRDIL